MKPGVIIDGAAGEGGGQILRTALSLSIVTGRPFRLTNIRARRPNPGLAAQHFTAVRLAAGISRARVGGARPGSTELYFEPGETVPGEYSLEVGTAGSTSLVLQTVAVPLALAPGSSRLHLGGGTHVPWSPSFDFLKNDWLPALTGIGLPLRVELERAGFYPRGGGRISVHIPGFGRLKPLRRTVRGNLQSVHGMVLYSRLTQTIPERIAREARRHLRRLGVAARVDVESREAGGPGAALFLKAVLEDGATVGFTSLSARNRQAERVAREAVNDLVAWLDTGAGVEKHLADQILVPLALADGPSEFTTSEITPHLVTNAEVIQRFLPARVRIEGRRGAPGKVRVDPGSG